MNKTVTFRDLGLIDYKTCWDFQEELFSKNVELKLQNRKLGQSLPTHNYLLFCEHPHVYTLGKSGDAENLLLNDLALSNRQASFFKINRGGDITYHGPGQLVAYPILDLDHFFTDIHQYLRYLEEAVILTLADLGIQAGRVPGLTGVWVNHLDEKNTKKICAMGVRCSRWVTMHGLALNVSPDLTYFKDIIPCGITDKAVTSIKEELGELIQMSHVKELLLKHLTQLFEFELKINESH